MAKEKTEEVKETKEEYNLVNVATQTSTVIQDSSGNILSNEQVLIVILNKLASLEKKL